MELDKIDDVADFGVPVGSSDVGDSGLLPKPNSTGSQILPTKPEEPYFIVPPGFRPNTFFIGMERELQQLDKKLFDQKRRKNGTACVLIHAQAGAGKSHLARQYVHKHRKKFPGGVFWICARLIEEIWKDWWQIAQKVVSKDSPELRIAGDETGTSFVEVVKEWFQARQEWLIILDGVTADTDEDITELSRFVPNSKNSSLIFVSRAKNLETLERLLRPQAVKVAPLKDDDARKLLFKSIPITHPREAQIKSATELVKKVGGLPLAINAISYRIAYTHEPLEKYTIRSYSEDEKIGGRYHEIMDDLIKRGHTEAFNLVNILCFYGPHIPVEMLRFGHRVLRHEKLNIKSSQNGETADVNTTFGILMRYGLVERNEPDDKESMSSDRSSIMDPEPIDILTMHTVVQKFCCDRLNKSELLPTWLRYAIRLFCHSYKEADIMIKSRLEKGRVSDYREYLVHGQRLRAHTFDYESKIQLLGRLRTELDPTLLRIKEEIRSREPSSSQESVNRADFQISIFDRTSNASSSGNSVDISQRSRRPPPLPLSENEFGIPLSRPETDSPRSIGTASPAYEARLLDHSLHARFPPSSNDVETAGSTPMQHDLSNNTVRGRAISTGSQGPPWQVVSIAKKNRQPEYSGDNFDRSPARSQVDRQHATGSVIQPLTEPQGGLSGSSVAVTSLTRMHHASPPPSRGSLWSRSSSSRPAAASATRPTYAGVLAGKVQQHDPAPTIAHTPPTLPSDSSTSTAPADERGRTRPKTVDPGVDKQPRSPLRSEISPSPVAPYLNRDKSANSNYVLSQPGSGSSFHPYYASQDENTNPRWYNTHVSGPNPDRLPLEQNITIVPRQSMIGSNRDLSYGYDSQRTSRPGTVPDTSAYQFSKFDQKIPSTRQGLPQGYHSQPMSREASQFSRVSGTATEPVPDHPSSISPYLTAEPPEGPGSPRFRNVDGSPAYKSPKLGYSNPIPMPSSPLSGNDNPSHGMGYSDSALLSGTGGWAAFPTNSDLRRVYQFSGAQSDFSPTSGVAAGSPMSRLGSSSGGPGMALEGGMIAEFGHSSEVRFGEFEPVSVADARQRIREWETALKRKEDGGRGDGRGIVEVRYGDQRGGSGRQNEDDGTIEGLGIWNPHGRVEEMPYPEINRIPTE